MSIRLLPISEYDENYPGVIALYRKSFPGAQRIPAWFLRFKLRNGKAGFSVLYSGDRWIGLIYLTEHEDVVFIHFLAIAESCRSSGYGGQVLAAISDAHAGKRIILNIEPLDEQAANYRQRVKRKSFYERCGFRSSGYLVQEPGEQFEMLVLGGTISKREIEEIYRKLLGRILGLLLAPTIARI